MRMRATTTLFATVLVALVAGVLPGFVAASADAKNRATPRHFTGYGFDQCRTPSQEAMDAWLRSSPYWAVGIYIAGDSRYCGDAEQEHLTKEWVATQLRRGWRLLPITVGPQAACADRYKDHVRISGNPADNYAAARVQGKTEARRTVRRAQRLGLVKASTLWYDIEAFDTSKRRCRESALTFLTAWTRALHGMGYVSGVYSSAASGISALDDARVDAPKRYTMPDRVWIAEWVAAASYRRPPRAKVPTLGSAYVRDDAWMPRGRVRQYRGDHEERYGGVRINIDTNYLDLGKGTQVGLEPRFCGTQVSYPAYRRLRLGDRHPQVKAAQCLLKKKGLYPRKVSGHYSRATKRAVGRLQARHDLLRNGNLNRGTWMALLGGGHDRILKYGSGGNAVRRLQRTVNAATDAALSVDGFYGHETTRAVRGYQQAVGLPTTGVAAETTWAALLSAR